MNKTRTALFLCFALSGLSGYAKWEKLENCALKTSEYMDGDSFHVQVGSKDYIFRLYFVDTPETDESLVERMVDQAKYWGIKDSLIPKLGHRAAQVTLRYLKPGFTVFTQWEDAKGSSSQPRFFAVVVSDKKDLADVLVGEGLARVYGASAQMPNGASVDAEFAKLRQLEQQAKAKKRGVWGRVKQWETPAAAAAAKPAEGAGTGTNVWFDVSTLGPSKNVPTVAFMQAEAFINTERFEEAEPELKMLLSEYGEHVQKPRIEFYLALCAAMQERFKEGIELFQKWLKDYPNDGLRAEVEFWMPIAMYYDGQYDAARPLLSDYAAKYPMSVYAPEAKYRAALCYYATENYKESAAALKTWLEQYPDHYFKWEALVTRADALAADGQLAEAKATYMQTMTTNAGPFYYLALTQITKVYKALDTGKDYREMAGVFSRYIQDEPESGNVIDAAYQSGWALRKTGDNAGARRLYWATIERYGNNPRWEGFEPLIQDLAGLYATGETNTFAVDFKKATDSAIQLGRLTLLSRLDLSRIQKKKISDKVLAAFDYEKRYKIEVLGPEGLAFLGDTFSQAKRFDAARPFFEKILKDFPESRFIPLAHARLGEISLAAGDLESALEHEDAAISQVVDAQVLMEATFDRAQCLQGLQRYAEAMEDFNTVLASRVAPRPMKPQALLGMASCLEEAGKFREAIPFYQRVYVMYQAYTSSVATAYLKSGAAFEKINDIKAAINTYREMLELESVAKTPEAVQARERLAKLES